MQWMPICILCNDMNVKVDEIRHVTCSQLIHYTSATYKMKSSQICDICAAILRPTVSSTAENCVYNFQFLNRMIFFMVREQYSLQFSCFVVNARNKLHCSNTMQMQRIHSIQNFRQWTKFPPVIVSTDYRIATLVFHSFVHLFIKSQNMKCIVYTV